MRFGFSPVQSDTTFDAMFRQARLAESLGFETLWAHEHHGGGVYPTPLMTLAALAGQTRQIRLGTNVLLLPLYHPLRVAEDAAMVDVLSGGRLTLGVGAGYAPSEFRAFGVPLAERGRRMREGLELIRALWTQDRVTMRGATFDLEDASLFPKPVQQPAPPLYVGAVAPAAIRRAARLGDRFLIGATPGLDEIRERIALYRQTLHEMGVDPATRGIALNRIVFVARDRTETDRAQRFFTERLLQAYDRWGHSDITRLDDRARAIDEVSRQRFIIGEPVACRDLIQQYAEMGIEHLACLMNFGGPDPEAVEVAMRRLAEQVMPHCSGP